MALTFFIFFGGLLLLVFIKVPIGIALGVISFSMFIIYGLPIQSIAQQFYSGVDSFSWVAIPLFVLAGNLMSGAGLSKRLADFAQSLVGHIRGGLGISTIFACAFFSAISGSSPATVAAVGPILMPEMKKNGYSERFAAAITASGGVLGILIPPSVTMVVYGILAEVSITKLFMAGVIPGILVSITMMVVTFFLSKKESSIQNLEKFSPKKVSYAFKRGIWPLLCPVIILGGIYSGIFTATEAAAVAVVYGLFVGLMYKEINMGIIREALKVSALNTGMLAIIWASAASYSQVLTISGVTQSATKMALDLTANPIVIVLIFSVIIIIAGCFINATGMVIMLTPLFVPVLKQVGFDPLAFGIIFTVACEIGFITPPVGTNLFVAKTLCSPEVDITDISITAIPYMLLLMGVIVLLTLIPEIAVFLPNRLY